MKDQIKLGQIIEGEAHRDAVHVAIAPVMAGCTLSPGERVGFIENGVVGCVLPHVGVVDPFLPKPVWFGETCWLFLFPNTVTDLRHSWSHPAFKEQAPVKDEGDYEDCAC
jgi:hypothetical protein